MELHLVFGRILLLLDPLPLLLILGLLIGRALRVEDYERSKHNGPVCKRQFLLDNSVR